MNCIFCQIAQNQESENYRIIYDDGHYLAMLVSHPETRGHFIVFPKNHASNMDELENKGIFFETALKLAEEKIGKLSAKAYTLKLNNKIYMLEDNPLHVGHIHMHVIPRYSKDDLKGEATEADRDGLNRLKEELL